MTTDYAIQTKGLTKLFKNALAVNNLDLEVEKGWVYGFLGLNGAGKTTTIKMLLNLLYPSRGEGRVLGYDIVNQSLEIREKVGYVPEEPAMYDFMKVSEILDFCRGTYTNWDTTAAGRYMDLFELAIGKKVKELSKGMKNQLALVIALGARPELLILDEPTGGLDPVKTRDFFRVVLEQVAETGQTVFFSSHQLYEVERVADTVGIIHKGQMVFSRELDEIKTNLKRIRVVFTEEKPGAILEKLPGVTTVIKHGRGYLLECDGRLAEITAELKAMAPADMEILDMNLEDVFMHYTGGEHHG